MTNFISKLQEQFTIMCKTGKLFRSLVSGQQVWDLYLESFDVDPVFRDPNSTTHNCNLCNNFLRRYGNVVAIDSTGNIITMFGHYDIEEPYTNSFKKINELLSNSKIQDVFFETFDSLNSLPYEKTNKTQSTYQLGIPKNHKRYTKEEAEMYPGVVKANEVRTFNHFTVSLPKAFVDFSGNSIESITGMYRDKYKVFKRCMEEIPLDTLHLVRDLINQGSLLDGTSHLHSIEDIIKANNLLLEVTFNELDNWFWTYSYSLEERVAKFKNTLIGTLCTELAEGEELNKACLNWNKRVDPANYHKATAPITQKQIKEAQKFVEENDYEESFNRRLATIDDINVYEIKHINSGDGSITKASIFDNVKSTTSRHKRNQFDNVEEVGIEKFMSDILPTCTSVEAYLENRMDGNLVTLTKSVDDDSKPIFKWDNNYSWTFNGNLAGKSQLSDMVEAKGGRTDGVFRFTHSWNEIEPNQSLMDLHVFMPGNKHSVNKVHDDYGVGRRVGWNNRKDVSSGGIQDVDYTHQAPTGYIPVENITFPTLSRMPEGEYICKIHNWSFRNSGGRGKAEIAIGSNIYQYEYPTTKHKEWVTVATVTLKGGKFSIEHHLPETNSSRELWGLDTNNFHKVNLVCLSPNHWGDNNVGNLHYMFMLDKCVPESSIRGFHNENLLPDLLKHKKVMEVLGNTNMIEPNSNALAGVGFNSTVRDELIVKCSGNFKRVIKLKF